MGDSLGIPMHRFAKTTQGEFGITSLNNSDTLQVKRARDLRCTAQICIRFSMIWLEIRMHPGYRRKGSKMVNLNKAKL